MSKVATIERINKLEKHPNADTLDMLTVGGWRVVAKQGQYVEGDLCVYIAPDTIVDLNRPIYEFLKNKHFRIKQIKLRGEVSNGLCLPIHEAVPGACKVEGQWQVAGAHGYAVLEEGTDVSDLVGAKHYEKELPACLAGVCRSTFPSFMKKTDEDNLRSNIKALAELQGIEVYITEKLDGSSATYYAKDGQFGVCSRNMDLLPDDNNTFWKMARKYDLENKLLKFGFNIGVQGEVVGPGIQGNKLGLTEVDLALFNVYDINNQQRQNFDTLVGTVAVLGTKMPRVLFKGIFNHTLADLLKMANELTYPNGSPAEGIVIRPVEPVQSKVLKGVLSVKVISEVFSGKYSE
jgi:RNA ligase (TIGR02306 family)